MAQSGLGGELCAAYDADEELILPSGNVSAIGLYVSTLSSLSCPWLGSRLLLPICQGFEFVFLRG